MDLKKQAVEIISKHIEEWESDDLRMESGYQYESSYVEMMKKVGHEILQASLGEVAKNKNLKKSSNPMWYSDG